MAHNLSASRSDRRKNGGLQKDCLIGMVTTLTTSASGRTVKFELDERTIKEEEVEEGCLASTSTGSNKKARQHVHRIIFCGDWAQLIAQDFQKSKKIKLYLNAYEPQVESDGRRKFSNGVRADLLFALGPSQLTFFLKTIDIGPRCSDDLAEPSPKSEEEPDVIVVSSPRDSQADPQDNLHDRREIDCSSDSRPSTKRTLVVEDHLEGGTYSAHHDEPSASTKKQNFTASSQNPHKRVQIHPSEAATPIRHPSGNPKLSQTPTRPTLAAFNDTTRPLATPVNTSTTPRSVPSRTPRVPTTVLQKQVFPMKTLDEIDKIAGGPRDAFNVIAYIDEKQSEECERAARGTSDFKMTLYLKDCSRPMATRNVTCNLFWKTAQNCPPWGQALWKVIFLFNVHKRASSLYDTQIIGPSNQFQWALWCPAYTGSAEKLISSNSNLDQFSSLFDSTPADLKAQALALYQPFNDQTTSHLSSAPALPAIQSVPKTIAQLQPGFRQKFDLCVRILDLWVDGVGNDRMTVTDFTKNPVLRMEKPDTNTANPTPVLRFHEDHGGNDENWVLTSCRVMTVYIEPPILQAIYGQFDGEASRNPNMHDYRGQLLNKTVRLNQLDLRVGAGSHNKGVVYGFMANLYKPRSARHDQDYEIDPDSLPLLADRIVPLTPSEPAFRKLLQDEAIYQESLEQAV
ncbi:hypothetical protein MJO28_001024 [Puccinia striiformis f. sp. tritici]|uniref:Uncharacterized protein n=2 Tax=Puccinia striiformis f. sp. tritici TaxID=168172 RepID=A0A0L0UVW8_9BASI|nr:hypothetical protein Pst134EA_000225 [Puccinia striiformis f. sp. tritici]KAI9599987.1 hypothetical protein KEM48_000104 [Puccinia striiformis f. sp. tritici PST-130]KNE91163.1 hypothetical protein PSTG_15421 [Puccinia striiformis f. sp. tritici PST-78]KAH9466383.1 hypothetical protein Pst134EB_001436 [Puccinia striiformis f. sp. tritici]KAH9473150.1 hypothetical protein Pst134EA_000225 [Puccinia striiformis f. sp. tritici]KAI7962930.1 hypothetical protein MJO28_001024 [Puccinia striiformis